MFTKDPMLVPWDFSDRSKDALARTVELADSLDQIEVIHVTPYYDPIEPGVIWGALNDAKLLEDIKFAFRKEVPEEKYPGLRFKALFGDPGSSITEYAKKIKAGLIVISSHGRTGLSRLFLGSVAERVVRLSPCPVLVLRDDKAHNRD